MLDPKKQFYITLTEPVVFLRTSDPSGRLQRDSDDSPALVRGILTLNVVKPIAISSIDVELTGILAINPELKGSGPPRTEFPEKQKIYTSTVTVFRADQVPRERHSPSVLGRAAANSSGEDERAASTFSRPPSLPRGRSERRNVVHSYPRTPTDLERRTHHVPPDPGPTPPYTPVAQSPTPIQPRHGAPGEHPAQTLEDLRQALRDDLEGQAYCNGLNPPSSRSPSMAFSLSNRTTHSNASNTSLHRENDSRTDDMVHTSPPFEGSPSCRNSTEESPHVPPRYGPSPSRSSPAHSLENTRDSSNTPASRSRLRLPLTSILDAVREVTSRAPSRSQSVVASEERERGRTRVRIIPEEQSRPNNFELGEGAAGAGSSSQPGANESHPSGYTGHGDHHLLGPGRVRGLERDHEREKDGEQKSKERGESWREFKPGTYSYPISFLLPPHLPPTFSVPHGSLNYAIKGVAHRPGAFTSKLSCQAPLLVVVAPAIGTGEGGGAGDPGPLFIQKQWLDKLAYSFGLSSPLFLLGSERHLETVASESARTNNESPVEVGVEARAEAAYGTATLDLTLLPLEKIKIWGIGVVVDQRIRYLDEREMPLRGDDKRQVKLLEVQDTCSPEEMDLGEEEQTQKNKQKHKPDSARIPLLPTPISPHRSPLLRYLPSSTDPSVLAGPGPYVLSTNIGLPGCNDASGGDSSLHFTMKQKGLNVRVEHSLRLVIKVEWVGDEGTNDHQEGEGKRLFDMTVQAPITVLSCRCIPECQTLPRYSQVTEESLQDRTACPCQPPTEREHGHEVGHVMTPRSASSFESEHDEQRSRHDYSRSPSHARRSGHPSPLAASLRSHPPSPASRGREAGWNRSPSHAQTLSPSQHHPVARSPSYTASTSQVRGRSRAPSSRPPSPLARYERLVSGLESEAGEAPPSYESVASGP